MVLANWARKEHIDCINRLVSLELAQRSDWKLVNVRTLSFGGGGLDRQYEVILDNPTATQTQVLTIDFVEFDDLFNEGNEGKIRDLVRRGLKPFLHSEI